jgi:diadenosine tetraphosphate (Ap4A) HIT family hydrolase
MEECYFCKIQKQGVPNLIAEFKYFLAKYSLFPVNPGHCEIFPKRHVKDIFDFTEEEENELFGIQKIVIETIMKKFRPDGFNTGNNIGLAGGQTISHMHWHVIPRYKGDVENPRGGVRNIIPQRADYTKTIHPHEAKVLDVLRKS